MLEGAGNHKQGTCIAWTKQNCSAPLSQSVMSPWDGWMLHRLNNIDNGWKVTRKDLQELDDNYTNWILV